MAPRPLGFSVPDWNNYNDGFYSARTDRITDTPSTVLLYRFNEKRVDPIKKAFG